MNEIRAAVSRIIEAVRTRGDRALIALLRQHDGVSLAPRGLAMSRSERSGARSRVSADLRRALESAYRNVTRFHGAERRRLGGSWAQSLSGMTLGQRISPMDCVGIYAPGGRFVYPSTVLMVGAAARAAGVKRLILCTPPKGVTPELLYAAHLVRVDEIFRVGGPAAIAAMAYGTARIPKVDLIAGPGNAFVTEAKRQVFGQVGIDMLAGPSEIVIIADRYAEPELVAADLMAQAEHDPMARGILLTDSRELANAVRRRMGKRFNAQVDIRVVRSRAQAVRAADECAPEHLQLMVRNSGALARRPWKAGAIFVGNYSSVVVGDYWAGPSHVLPTGKSARFSSGLSVATFMRRSSVISMSRRAFRHAAPSIASLAKAEGLEFHSRAVMERL